MSFAHFLISKPLSFSFELTRVTENHHCFFFSSISTFGIQKLTDGLAGRTSTPISFQHANNYLVSFNSIARITRN